MISAILKSQELTIKYINGMQKNNSYGNFKNLHRELEKAPYIKPSKMLQRNRQGGELKKKDVSLRQITNRFSTHQRMKYQPLKTDKNIAKRKIKTLIESPGNQKQENYDTIKARLYALEDRLTQIKKSYETRKQKSVMNFSSDKKGVEDKENNQKFYSIKPSKMTNNHKQISSSKEKSSKCGFAIKNQKNNRLGYQSPKNQPLKILCGNKNYLKQDKEMQKDQSSIIAKYITQQEQRPAKLKHISSQTCLQRPATTKALISPCNKDKNQQKKNIKQNQYYLSAIFKAHQSSSPTSFDLLSISHFTTSFEFLKHIKRNRFQKPNTYRSRPLPPIKNGKKHTIIFDLDETLIHCHEAKKGPADVMLPVNFPDRKTITIGINVRPFARQCIQQLSQKFQIMVFTASHASYAKTIVDFLDPERKYIEHWYSRDDCFKAPEGFYVKDLRIIDRKLSNLLLIDNAAYSYCLQPDNGVPIVPFYDNKADLELKQLISYLKKFQNEIDVRVKNSLIMKIGQYSQFTNCKDLMNELKK